MTATIETNNEEDDKDWDEVAKLIGGKKLVLDTETLFHLKESFTIIPKICFE